MNADPPLDLAALLGELAEYETTITDWDAGKRNVVDSLRSVIEQLHGEALRRLLKALKSDPTSFAALKDVAGDPFVYAVLRRHALIKPSLNERVEDALASVRPMLAGHGGDVELLRIEPPCIEVRFTGACDGCAASLLTFHSGVKKAVQDACPEITEVRQVKGSGKGGTEYTSPFALEGAGTWLAAGALAEFAENEVHFLILNAERLVLWRQGAAVTCFKNACAHMGLRMDGGFVENGALECPNHNFRFDLVSGECLDAPDLHLTQYAVRIVDGRVEVRL